MREWIQSRIPTVEWSPQYSWRTKNKHLRRESEFLSEAPTNSVGNGGFTSSGDQTVAGFDPVLISLIRRAMPNLVAYDLAGVQPMSGPTGLIFAMRSRYTLDRAAPKHSSTKQIPHSLVRMLPSTEPTDSPLVTLVGLVPLLSVVHPGAQPNRTSNWRCTHLQRRSGYGYRRC